MGSFCAFPSCSKQLPFSLFGSFCAESRPFLTLFHPYIHVHTRIAPCLGRFRLSVCPGQNLF